MKRILFVLLASVVLTMALAALALAVKPAANLAGNVKVSWNLSADVMPAPPYGSFDIPGSDTASKLNVNQPNGNTEVTITGAMNGLVANTTYTVYLSNGYTPYAFAGWNVAGSWDIDVEYSGIIYPETLILTQVGTEITGVSLNTDPPAPGSAFTVVSGSVTGNDVEIFADHDPSTLIVRMEGTIAADGSMSGNWADFVGGSRVGTWASTSGNAVKTYDGDDYWTGLFTPTIQPFTFTTDEFGAGSWHINMRDSDFVGPGSYALSVWINAAGGTLLISDTFVVVE